LDVLDYVRDEPREDVWVTEDRHQGLWVE